MKKDKIGILTFHYSTNYGGVLQSIYLVRFLNSLGYNAEIINFIPNSYKFKNFLQSIGLNRSIFQSFSFSKLFNVILRSFVYFLNFVPVTYKFYSFKKKYGNYSRRLNHNSFDKFVASYSHLIVGSDQVWNPYQRDSKVYFLSIDYEGKRISYAADSTNDSFDFSDKSFLMKSLKKFDHLSVRNFHTQQFVKSVSNLESLIVLDPTLLSSFEDHIALNSFPKVKYILFYILGDSEKDFKNYINILKLKFNNLPFYSIKMPFSKYSKSTIFDKEFNNLGPTEFLSFIKNSVYFITDSFHGVLFSLKFGINFASYYTDSLRAPRLIDIKTRFNLHSNVHSSIENLINLVDINSKTDLSNFKTVIEEYYKVSLDFITKALK